MVPDRLNYDWILKASAAIHKFQSPVPVLISGLRFISGVGDVSAELLGVLKVCLVDMSTGSHIEFRNTIRG